MDLRNIILEEYIHITAQVLSEYNLDMRRDISLYYDSSMTPPQICNTDGAPMVFQYASL